MKTRIILKSFDALSYGVFLSQSPSDPTAGLGSSRPTPIPMPASPPKPAVARTDRRGSGVALSEGAVWAGLMTTTGRKPPALTNL